MAWTISGLPNIRAPRLWSDAFNVKLAAACTHPHVATLAGRKLCETQAVLIGPAAARGRPSESRGKAGLLVPDVLGPQATKDRAQKQMTTTVRKVDDRLAIMQAVWPNR